MQTVVKLIDSKQTVSIFLNFEGSIKMLGMEVSGMVCNWKHRVFYAL